MNSCWWSNFAIEPSSIAYVRASPDLLLILWGIHWLSVSQRMGHYAVRVGLLCLKKLSRCSFCLGATSLFGSYLVIFGIFHFWLCDGPFSPNLFTLPTKDNSIDCHCNPNHSLQLTCCGILATIGNPIPFSVTPVEFVPGLHEIENPGQLLISLSPLTPQSCHHMRYV